jgi:hypothetical protein
MKIWVCLCALLNKISHEWMQCIVSYSRYEQKATVYFRCFVVQLYSQDNT